MRKIYAGMIFKVLYWGFAGWWAISEQPNMWFPWGFVCLYICLDGILGFVTQEKEKMEGEVMEEMLQEIRRNANGRA